MLRLFDAKIDLKDGIVNGPGVEETLRKASALSVFLQCFLLYYVYLDQKNLALVRVGDHAQVLDAARPEVRLAAKVSRTSMELDVKTRTLLIEIDVDNRQSQPVSLV